MQTDNRFVVIMAGGSGTRLWPLSRTSKPKQFHKFLSEKTLLEETFDRAKRLVPENQIFLSAGSRHIKNIYEIFPNFPKERLIIEPFSKNTAPAISLVSAIIRAKFPNAIIATIASDHAIRNEDAFVKAIADAFDIVDNAPDKLVTIGINPTKPDTGLGYIKLGQEISSKNDERVFFVEAFKEKPDRTTAEKYLTEFGYLWNAGYFIFSPQTFSQWLEKFSPALSRIEKAIYDTHTKKTLDAKTLETIYAKMPEVAIEPALVEKLPANTRLVIPAPIKWSDVGSWDTLCEFLKNTQEKENIEQGIHIHIDSHDNFIHSNKRVVATIGARNLVIIDTDDTILVARRDRANEMKKLIEELKNRGLERLL